MTRLVALIATTFLLGAAAFAQTLKPLDQSAKDPKLAELIATLIKACDRKDFKPFEAALSPDAIGSFGGDPGVRGFKVDHDIDSPGTTFYTKFKDAVSMGGAFTDVRTFAAPYVFALWPDDLDGFEWIAATGSRTMLYAKPENGAKTLADVTHQFLEFASEAPYARDAAPAGWLHVKAGRTTGYVKESQARSPMDYRAVFENVDGRWRLRAFVAGD